MTSGKKRTHEEFIKAFKSENPHAKMITVVGSYIKNTEPIECRCEKCGIEWFPTPKALLRGSGCPSCAGNLKLSHDKFMQLLKQKNIHYPDIEILGQYNGMSKRIKCRCRICDTEWTAKANDLIRAASGCPSCAGSIPFTQERFLKELKKRSPYYSSIKILGKYTGMLNPIECKCVICGREWSPIPSSLLQGSGCPDCAKKRIAEKGKEVLKRIPRQQPISHDEFLSKLKKGNPHSNAIEIISDYKGAKRTVRCRCKICGCIWNAIPGSLIRGTGCPDCSHSSTSFMEQFVLLSLQEAIGKDNVVSRDKDTIGMELDIMLLKHSYAIEIGSWVWHKDVVQNDKEKQKRCNKKGITLLTVYDSYTDEPKSTDNIITYSFDLGLENGHVSLKALVEKILSLIGEKHSFSKETWLEIERKAYQYSQRIDHKSFVTSFLDKNVNAATISFLSEYTRATDPIHCKCEVCNHEWFATPSDLLKGTGCPRCSIKAVGRRRSKEAQIHKWREEHPNGTKIACERETGISRVTIYKWWNT